MWVQSEILNVGAWKKTPVPVWRFLQNLVEADSECFILVALPDEIFVNPKLGRCDGLSFWNTREVESKFSSVLLVQTFLIVINYCREERRNELIWCAYSFIVTMTSQGSLFSTGLHQLTHIHLMRLTLKGEVCASKEKANHHEYNQMVKHSAGAYLSNNSLMCVTPATSREALCQK